MADFGARTKTPISRANQVKRGVAIRDENERVMAFAICRTDISNDAETQFGRPLRTAPNAAIDASKNDKPRKGQNGRPISSFGAPLTGARTSRDGNGRSRRTHTNRVSRRGSDRSFCTALSA